MPLFCGVCNNLLSVITLSDNFYFRCMKCYKTYKPNDADTLRFEEIKGTNLLVYKTILKTAGKDPVNPKVKVECKKCHNDIAKQVRLGEDMRLINICVNCDNQWIEGTDENI